MRSVVGVKGGVWIAAKEPCVAVTPVGRGGEDKEKHDLTAKMREEER